jgi:arylsulfatase A-like enzyme
VLSLRWKPDQSTNGTLGLVYSDYSQYGPGQGIHGSLSPFDMHNVCFAAGPDFRKGLQDDLPTGNTDIVPTVLWLLGANPEQRPSGRVLVEALIQAGDGRPPCEVRQFEANYRGEGFAWHQYLKYSQVSGVLYFDEGNGEQAGNKDIGGN